MHRRVVAGVASLLFLLMATLVVILTDLHDMGLPQALNARSAVSLDFSSSRLADDDEAFSQLASQSDQLDLGLVKVAPDLSGDQSGRIYVTVGTRADFPRHVDLFNDPRGAEVRDRSALVNSFASGQYLITSSGADTEAFKDWLTRQGVDVKWVDDSLLSTMRMLVSESSFAVSVVAAIALMVSLVLYWLSVKARGRALRVLAGTPLWRIQYEDLVGFLGVVVASGLACGAATVVFVGARYGWSFTSFALETLLVLDGVLLLVTAAFAALMGVLSIPTVKALATRAPGVGSLKMSATLLKATVFALVVLNVGPAFGAWTTAQSVAQEQARWRSLSDQVGIAISTNGGEAGFKKLMRPMGELVADAEARDAAALSYTWTRSLIEGDGGDLGGYSAVALTNQKWLDLMDIGRSDRPSEGPKASVLERVPSGAFPKGVKAWFGPSLELWTHERTPAAAAAALNTMSVYRYSGAESVPMASAGGGDLAFYKDLLVIVAPDLHATFDDEFLASLTSTRNVIFTGLGPTQQLIAAHGLQQVTRAQYVAEEGVLIAQVTSYMAWLQGVSLLALGAALAVAAAIGAVIAALLKARRDFPLRLAGTPFSRIVAPRVGVDWAVAVTLTALVLLARGGDSALVILAVTALAMASAPLAHLAATSWTFRNVSRRAL